MQHILIHVAPLSHCLNAGIGLIQAAAFDMYDLKNQTGYVSHQSVICPESCEAVGLCCEQTYVNDLLETSPLFFISAIPLYEGLCRLSRKFDWSQATVWADLSANHLALLENTYSLYGVDAPWKFWQKMDIQTIEKLGDFRKEVSKSTLASRVTSLKDALKQIEGGE